MMAIHDILTAVAPELLAPIITAWPGIFKWMVFFVDMEDNPGAEDLFAHIVDIIRSLLAANEARPIVLQTPGLVALVTSLWLKANSLPQKIEPHCSVLFGLLLHVSPGAVYDEVIQGAHGNLEEVAKQVLSRMRWAIKMHTPNTEVLDACFCISTYFEPPGRLRFSHAIFDNRGVVVYTRTLAKLAGLHRRQDHGMRVTMQQCILRISILIDKGDGTREVRHAIEEGLLQALVDTVPAYDQFTTQVQSAILTLIEKTISRCIIFRSVALAADAAIAALQPVDYRDIIDRSPLKDAWARMQCNVFHRARIARAMAEAKSTARCENVSLRETV